LQTRDSCANYRGRANISKRQDSSPEPDGLETAVHGEYAQAGGRQILRVLAGEESFEPPSWTCSGQPTQEAAA